MSKKSISKNILQASRNVASFPTKMYKKKPKTFVIFLLVLVVLAAFVGVGLVKRSDASVDQPSLDVVEQLPFNPLLPSDKTVQWRKVSPPGSEPVFAYSDTLADIKITVSEQQVPKKLRSEDKVMQLAEQFNATNKLKVGDFTTYIGRSAKGPQYVIFVKDDVLVLIRSSDTIDDSDWIRYVSSFK